MANELPGNRPAPGRFGQSRGSEFESGHPGGDTPAPAPAPEPADEWSLDDDAPPPPPAPPAAPVAPAALEESGDFASDPPAAEPPADPPVPAATSGDPEPATPEKPGTRRAVSRRDVVTVAAVAVVLLVAAGGFAKALFAGKPYSPPPAATVLPDLPMTGDFVKITEVSTGWRLRTDADRVSRMNVILPTPSQVYPEVLPQIAISIDPSVKGHGFVKFIVRNEEGRITGDIRLLEIRDGQVAGDGAGSSPETGTVYGTTGMLDRVAYYTYIASDSPRWYVEVSVSPDQSAGEEAWTPLGTFEIRNSLIAP